MASISIETRRVDELANTLAGSGDNDLLIIRLADGTGTKNIKVGDLRKILVGDLESLETEDKTGVVAAVNELMRDIIAEGNTLETLQKRTEILTLSGASVANSNVVEVDLGNSFTAEQSADIRAGKFEKVRTGGYWTINGHKYWAGHADYRLHCGDTDLTTHHMLVVPDGPMYNHVMNDTNVTTGAYYGSKMKTSGLAAALETIKQDFGASHILTHRQLLANAVNNGSSSGWAWYDTQIDLMNEHMVYGSHAWGGGSHIGYDTGIDKSQLALFQARPDLIHSRAGWYWLRDVYSATVFCGVSYGGYANDSGASGSGGVRPAFLIY